MDFFVEFSRSLIGFVFYVCVALGGIFLGKTLSSKKKKADASETEK